LKKASGFKILEYLTREGRNPFREWLDALDLKTKARVQARILRFEDGNLGDFKRLANVEILEGRLDFGRVIESISGWNRAE